jgi:hypothetical protein
MSGKSKFRFILFLIVLGSSACHVDHGLEPIPVIQGKIFLKGKRPDIAGELITVVAPDFPPRKWTDIVRTTPLEISPDYDKTNKDTIDWVLPLPTGSYDVVAILWKKHDEEWSFETVSNILGVYNIPNQFKPAQVIIQPGEMVVDSVDMKADFGMIRYGSFIKGKISYKGEFRKDTAMMILAAFPMKPEKVVDYLYAMGWDLTVPTNESAYPLHYALDISSGYIKYVAVFWKGEDSGPYDFKKIGEYKLQDDPPLFPGAWSPEGIWVNEGDTLVDKFYNGKKKPDSTNTRIDIVIDFDRTY